MKLDRCKACGAEIVWASLTSNPLSRTMLDARPWKSASKQGNVHLDTIRMDYIVLEPEMVQTAKERGFDLYTSHFQTCPGRERDARETTYSKQEREIHEHAN